MDHSSVKTFCDDLPGATREQPFGPGVDCWKVGGKIFALMAADGARVSLKCADAQMAEMLISVGRAGKAPYLPRGGWIAVSISETPEGELKERLLESYQTVRAALPKKLRATLGD